MEPPRVPTYYNFAWVPHTFGGLTPPDPPLFRTLPITVKLNNNNYDLINYHAQKIGRA